MSTSKWHHRSTVTDEERQRWQVQFKSLMDDGVLVKQSDGRFLPDFTQRVRAGMDLLDKICPGWQNELDLSLLDLEDDQQCVLGQSWSLYAKAHGLIENGDYKQFADAVLNLSPQDERNTFAAAIGCALNESDMAILNQQKTFSESLSLLLGESKGTFLNQAWEALTATWIAEIVKARVDGRWGPYTVETLDKSIKEGATT